MTTITDHDKQALDFLAKTGATLKIQFSRHGKHFDDDKETRDIYTVTIQRRQRSYTFDFGQSIANSGFYYTKGKQRIDLDRKYLGKSKEQLVFIIRGTPMHDRDFLNNGKSDIIHIPVAPTAYDILTCLTKYDPGTFEDFCGEFGYDTDSRRAEKTYNAVMDEYRQVAMLFDEDEMEQLREIQ